MTDWFVRNATDLTWTRNGLDSRPLVPWDGFHCPPDFRHVVVGAGDEPALVLPEEFLA